jgi:hypothetical protein
MGFFELLFMRALFETLKGDLEFCHFLHSCSKFQWMELKEFLSYPFTPQESRELRTLFCASMHYLMRTEHASELPSPIEIMAWVKTPNDGKFFPLYLKWYLLRIAIADGSEEVKEEAKTLLREHLLQHSRKNGQKK